jgi:hypothetical protein
LISGRYEITSGGSFERDLIFGHVQSLVQTPASEIEYELMLNIPLSKNLSSD